MNDKSLGFKFEPSAPDHWHLGEGKASERFGAVELMPGGHGWGKYLPDTEPQKRNIETMACTVYASLTAYETLARFKGFKDFPKDCSERFSAILAEVAPDGNSPHKSCEAIRKHGVIEEELLPFTDKMTKWEEYYIPKPMIPEYLELGKEVLSRFTLGHEYVFNGSIGITSKQDKLIEALGRGTVCVSVKAWKKKGDLYYKGNEYDNHWTFLVDYKDGEYWVVRDTYAPYDKKLAWDYDFQTAKLYFLTRKTEADKKNLLTLLQNLLELLKSKLGMPNPNSEKLYQTAKASLGMDITPNDIIPDDVSCVASLQEVYRRAFGVYIGTGATLYNTRALKTHLATDPRFTPVSWEELNYGDIVVYGTGEGNPGAVGHCFVVGKRDWMNNHSDTGLWTANYTKAQVKAYWEDKLGFKPGCFRLK